MLAYDMNGAPLLSLGHGAPLRLRNETQLGFKQVKWIKGVEFVTDFADIGSGYGGYNQDHEFFGSVSRSRSAGRLRPEAMVCSRRRTRACRLRDARLRSVHGE